MSAIAQHDSDLEETPSLVSQFHEAAEAIGDDALERAQAKLSALLRHKSLEELLRRHDFLDLFKFELAGYIAHVVAANNQCVSEVYAFDPSENADAELGEYLPHDVSIHLLVRVGTLSAALEAFIASLDRALTQYLKELPAPLFANRTSIIDAVILSAAEVREGKGAANMLTSIIAPPLKIWARDS